MSFEKQQWELVLLNQMSKDKLAKVSVIVGLMARSVEIAVPIVVLLGLWRAGAPIIKSSGKYR